jgi:hypothetical protein
MKIHQKAKNKILHKMKGGLQGASEKKDGEREEEKSQIIIF